MTTINQYFTFCDEDIAECERIVERKKFIQECKELQHNNKVNMHIKRFKKRQMRKEKINLMSEMKIIENYF